MLLLHGTGGSGRAFLTPAFETHLFAAGKPFDASRYFLIMPDAIGHGGSSKPSDGPRMAFPKYDYGDMVEAQYRLLTEHFGIQRLRVTLGQSMGCMMAFEWATRHPDFAARVIPMACYPVAVSGQNRMQRKLQIDAIQADPAWMDGNYVRQPIAGLRIASGLAMLFGSNPAAMRAQYPDGPSTDAGLAVLAEAMAQARDANDSIYQVDASRNYDPWDKLGAIRARMLWINFQDDQVNPVSLDVTPGALARMPQARFVLIPASAATRGHGTLALVDQWAGAVVDFMKD